MKELLHFQIANIVPRILFRFFEQVKFVLWCVLCGESKRHLVYKTESKLNITYSGTIADREHRKWIEKAVPLSHNPYSKESLEKRLSRASVDSGTSTMQSRSVYLFSFVALEKYLLFFVPVSQDALIIFS